MFGSAGQKTMFNALIILADFISLCQFLYFCGQSVIKNVIMIDGSKHAICYSRWVLKFRVDMLLLIECTVQLQINFKFIFKSNLILINSSQNH